MLTQPDTVKSFIFVGYLITWIGQSTIPGAQTEYLFTLVIVHMLHEFKCPKVCKRFPEINLLNNVDVITINVLYNVYSDKYVLYPYSK